MTAPRSVSRLRLTLLVANVALLALTFISYKGLGDTTAAETGATPLPLNVDLDLPEPAASLPPLGQFDSFVERALFHASRRPLPVDIETAEPVGSLEGYSLKGTVIRPDTRVAVLEQAGQANYLRAAEGDVLAGWRLKKVETGRAVFERRGRSTVLEMAPFQPPRPHTEERDPSSL